MELTFEEVPNNHELVLNFLGLPLQFYDANMVLLTESLEDKRQEALRLTCLRFVPTRIDETKLRQRYKLPLSVKFVTVIRNINK